MARRPEIILPIPDSATLIPTNRTPTRLLPQLRATAGCECGTNTRVIERRAFSNGTQTFDGIADNRPNDASRTAASRHADSFVGVRRPETMRRSTAPTPLIQRLAHYSRTRTPIM